MRVCVRVGVRAGMHVLVCAYAYPCTMFMRACMRVCLRVLICVSLSMHACARAYMCVHVCECMWYLVRRRCAMRSLNLQLVHGAHAFVMRCDSQSFRICLRSRRYSQVPLLAECCVAFGVLFSEDIISADHISSVWYLAYRIACRPPHDNGCLCFATTLAIRFAVTNARYPSSTFIFRHPRTEPVQDITC
jgi:hypothetical protein